jgi:hypothetical protein
MNWWMQQVVGCIAAARCASVPLHVACHAYGHVHAQGTICEVLFRTVCVTVVRVSTVLLITREGVCHAHPGRVCVSC